MSKNLRIIPRLDIKGPNLVKGVHLEGLRVLGQPADFAKFYYENGADELIYIDSVASLYGRNNLTDILKFTAKNVFIPITVGGGLRTLEDISTVLRSGADKVAINTAAIENPEFLKEAAQKFGSQCIVLYVEAKKIDGEYIAFTDNAREITDRKVDEWIMQAQDLGVGEILLTSVDKEGTGRGFELDLLSRIAPKLEIPLIINGGAGNTEHVIEALENSRVDAVACSSLFHYKQNLLNFENVANTNEGVTEYFKKIEKNYVDSSFKRNQPCTIHELKTKINTAGFACRHEDGEFNDG